VKKLNKKSNVKNYTFSFRLFIFSFQRLRQTNSYFNYLLCEELFLYFHVEIAKTNDYWPIVYFFPLKAGGKTCKF
jgi:hypothetical protein